ncbi:hypothetical protein PybrP1_011092 [[Pythium] brassicae (nom. inval.)]|nr:hypothetical protein PybrP1_011092 [[Pythium] brassicae (nom. inval.)]
MRLVSRTWLARHRNRGYLLVINQTPNDAAGRTVCINVERLGSAMRFMNYSCEPAARFHEMAHGMGHRIVAVTCRAVAKGEELTVSYGEQLWFLTRPAWNNIFVRINMYESVLAFASTVSASHSSNNSLQQMRLNEIAFIRMRGASIHFTLLALTKELMGVTTSAELNVLVAGFKRFELADRAHAFLFAKETLLARAADATAVAAVKEAMEAITEVKTKATTKERTVSTSIDVVVDGTRRK